VICPLTTTRVTLTSPCDVYAATQKHRKYDEGFRGQPYIFAAVVFETTGAVNEEGAGVLRQLFRFAAKRMGKQFSSYCGRAWARLSCNLQRSISQEILTRIDGAGVPKRSTTGLVQSVEPATAHHQASPEQRAAGPHSPVAQTTTEPPLATTTESLLATATEPLLAATTEPRFGLSSPPLRFPLPLAHSWPAASTGPANLPAAPLPVARRTPIDVTAELRWRWQSRQEHSGPGPRRSARCSLP
jgi:hypothetical protein